MGVYFGNFGFGDSFLATMKVDELDFIKIKNFVL